MQHGHTFGYAPALPLLCRICSVHSQQFRNLSQLYFLNLQGNDLYVSGLGWVSHLSSLQYLYASGINLQREKKKALGKESAPFSFNIMVISMPTS